MNIKTPCQVRLLSSLREFQNPLLYEGFAISPHLEASALAFSRAQPRSQSQTMPNFQYSWHLSDTAIRLIQFSKDSITDGTLNLEINEYPLNALPPFHALSYTWGPPRNEDPDYTATDAVTVSLNGCEFKVYPNLFEALIRLKDSGLAERFWVDAICINQNDIKERESQVFVMDRIYKSADQVDIWLGRSDQFAAEVSRMITDMAELKDKEEQRLINDGQTRLFWDFENKDVLQAYGLHVWTEDVWREFVAFLERRWFKRAWILQEVTLAKSAVVLWDGGFIPWGAFIPCSQFLFMTNFGWGLNRMRSRRNSKTANDPIIGASLNALWVIQSLCHGGLADLHIDYVTALERIAGFSPKSQTTAHWLLLCILLSRPFQSTDKRDKIYALLGILNRIAEVESIPRLSLRPEYGPHSSAANAFTTAAVAIMTNCKHLGLLTMATDEAARTLDSLPSWVPDFSTIGPNPIPIVRGSKVVYKFDPSKSTIIGSQGFQIDGQNIHLKGHKTGNVAGMSKRGQIEQCAGLILRCDQAYPFTGEDRVEAFWRTLVYDMDYSQHPAPNELAHAFRRWTTFLALEGARKAKQNGSDPQKYLANLRNMRHLASSDPTKTIPSLEYLESCSRKLGVLPADGYLYTEDEREALEQELKKGYDTYYTIVFASLPQFYITDKGHMGLGPQSIKTGDTVWVISGCPSPLVLRRSEGMGDSPNTSKKYRLMGEAYVHGIMHGEAVDEKTEWDDICLI